MKKTLLLITALLLTQLLYSQSIERYVIGAAGGSYNDGTTYLDYTAGEVMVTTLNNVSNFLTQGFQQPFTNSTVAVEEVTEQATLFSIFPNPVVNDLTLTYSGEEATSIRMSLMNALGQLLSDRTVEIVPGENILIDFSAYATGNYYLRLQGNGSATRTFRLIRMNQ